MRGQPQTVSELTTASTDDVLAVLYVEADLANVGEIMRRMLAQFVEPAVLLFDRPQRRIIGSTAEWPKADLVALWEADDGPCSVFKPREGQIGVNLLWEAEQDDFALVPILGNDFQKRTFHGLVNTGLAQFVAQQTVEPCVLVNQITGRVHFRSFNVPQDLSGISLEGQTVCVKLAEAKPKLIFE